VDSSIEHLLESPWSQYVSHDGPSHPNAYGASDILVLVRCVLHEPPLSGYDGSLDDDPEFDVAYFDAPLNIAVGCVGHAPVAMAALRNSVVGVVGNGLLASVVATGST
jgi:hypothetical protein